MCFNSVVCFCAAIITAGISTGIFECRLWKSYWSLNVAQNFRGFVKAISLSKQSISFPIGIGKFFFVVS